MDQDFQTTFIPKRPTAPEAAPKPARTTKTVSWLSLVAIILFIASILISVGAYVYRQVLRTSIEEMQQQILLAEQEFEPSTIIELQELDTRLNSASQLLNAHIAVSPLFEMLEDSTLRSVRFSKMNYEIQDGRAMVSMSGLADSYEAIAQQSSVFGDSNYVDEHIFSNFTLTSTSKIAFDVQFEIDEQELLYVNTLSGVDITSTDNDPLAGN